MGTAIRTITDHEKGKWDVLKPTHMSEEEEMDSGVILRRRPIWRSAELNAFLDTLDVRANNPAKKSYRSWPMILTIVTKIKWILAKNQDS